MIDFSTPEFAEMKRRALARAQEFERTSYTDECPNCHRNTLHYQLPVLPGEQLLYRCAGCRFEHTKP